MAQNTLNTPRETTIQRIATALENILNKIVDTSRASNIDYDNTESDLTADKVQGAIDELAEEKVDKVTGKGLSTNDYTNSEKQKNADNASAIEDIQEDISQSLTATGNPITIQASESNLVECTAEVEAVQEGSGDPSPDNIRPIIGQTEVVIADVGKNILPMTVSNLKQGNTEGTWSGNTYTIYGISYKVNTDDGETVTSINCNGTSANYATFNLVPSGGERHTLDYWGLESGVLYVLSGTTTEQAQRSDLMLNGEIANVKDTGNGVTISVTSEKYAPQIRINPNTTISNYVFYPMIRKSTDSASFEPYKGKTYRVEIGQKNKLPMTVDGIKSANTSGTWSGNSYTHNNTTFTILTDSDDNVIGINVNTGSGGASNTAVLYVYYNNNGLSNFIGLKLNGVVSGSGGSSTYGLALEARGIKQYNGNDYIIANDDDTSKGIYIRVNSGTSVSNDMVYPMIRTTIDDNEFAPYNPNLPDAIYGGELDVVTGKMVVDKVEKVVTTSDSFRKATLANCDAYVFDNCVTEQNRYAFTGLLISDKFKVNTSGLDNKVAGEFYFSTARTLAFCFETGRFASDSDFATWLNSNPIEVCYQSATPYTIQLTPEQIRLLKGTNHLSCNGDLSIKYYPDNVLGQLKGDIEDEYDERVEVLEEKAENALKIKSIATTTGTNQQGVSSSSYDNYVQGDKKLIPVSITAKTPGYEVVDVHYVLDEINRLIYFIPKDLTGNAIPSGRTVSMTIYYFEI